MLEAWYNETLFDKHPSDANTMLARVLNDSRVSRRFVSLRKGPYVCSYFIYMIYSIIIMLYFSLYFENDDFTHCLPGLTKEPRSFRKSVNIFENN